MADMSAIFEELWKKSGGRCMRCGKPLTEEDEAVIAHIFPQQYGGTDRIENLRLLCEKCYGVSADHYRFNESLFQQYLQQLLLHDSRFENVRTDVRINTSSGQKVIFDLMFSRTMNGAEQQYVVEVKGLSAATSQRVESAIQQLDYYKRIYPQAHFILAVPTLLAKKYRQRVRAAGLALWDSEILRLGVPDLALPVCAAPDRYDRLIYQLSQCKPGYEDWQIYQRLVGEILSVLFCPPLDPVSEQSSDGYNANRRDFIVPNYSSKGYWLYLRDRYQAEFIVVDAKNLDGHVKKDDILQVAHYLKQGGAGLFGIIFSRHGIDEKAEIYLRDVWLQERKMIVILDDDDVEQMLLNKQGGNDPCRIIIEKIQEFRLKI